VRQASFSIAADPAELATARRFAEARLSEWGVGSECDSVVLVVSELATNAVIHGGSAPQLRMTLDGAVLRIEVRDESRALPQVKGYSETATTGRGMVIVEALSTAWGTEVDDRGKVVWCELAAPQAGKDTRAAGHRSRSGGEGQPDEAIAHDAKAPFAFTKDARWGQPLNLVLSRL
jgi:anti-sigma regulatory factor (Ser/Thr protein kinase)